jgi:hypothetical protein
MDRPLAFTSDVIATTLPFGMVALFAGIGIRRIMRLRQRCATPA